MAVQITTEEIAQQQAVELATKCGWDTDELGYFVVPCRGGCGRVNRVYPVAQVPLDTSRKAYDRGGNYLGEWGYIVASGLGGWECGACMIRGTFPTR